MTVYLTSDLHFGHPHVAGLRLGRPDADRHDMRVADEHDRRVLDVINAHVGVRDELYILGDLSGGSRPGVERAARLVARLNPPARRLHLIIGNHDANASGAFRTLIHPLFGEVARMGRLETDGRAFVLSHYPWRHLMDGATVPGVASNAYSRGLAPLAPTDDGCGILLHGHTHSPSVTDPRGARMIHVGWDAWRRPVPLDEIAAVTEVGTVG